MPTMLSHAKGRFVIKGMRVFVGWHERKMFVQENRCKHFSELSLNICSGITTGYGIQSTVHLMDFIKRRMFHAATE